MLSVDPNVSILVVDDDAMSRRLIARQLNKLGYPTCDTAEDGVIALERLASRKYDFVLLDVIMPRMSGIDVLRWIGRRPQLDRARVIVISAEDSHVSRQAAWDLGASDVLLKPFSSRVLQSRLRRAEHTAPPTPRPVYALQ